MRIVQKTQYVDAIQWVGEENCHEVFDWLGWEHPEDELDHSLIYVTVCPNGLLETEDDWEFSNPTVEVTWGAWFVKDSDGGIRVIADEVFRTEFEVLPE